MRARALCLQGFVDQAVDEAQASLQEALVRDHKHSICEVLRLAVYPVALMTGDIDAAEQAMATLLDIATSLGSPFWQIAGHCLKGRLLIKRGYFETGSALLRGTLDKWEKSGWTVWHPEFLGALAEGMAGLGQLAEAHATIEQALAKADRGGERWFVAELLRIKGELHFQKLIGHVVADGRNPLPRSAGGGQRTGCSALAIARRHQPRPFEA